MNLDEFFERVEDTTLARFREAGFVQHSGDKGENREAILREFLSKHLPKRFGVTKGEVVTKAGEQGHSADVIIYDAPSCPVLFIEETAVVPIEGVYGIIEVKSRLSKAEFRDAAGKIEAFKKLAPRYVSVIQTRQYVTLHRPSRPFGIVMGFDLAANSLQSLSENFEETMKEAHWVNNFVNLLAVLGNGIVRFERIDFDSGEKHLMLGTDEIVELIEREQKRSRDGETEMHESFRLIIEEAKSRTFGRFFVYLLVMLERMKLGFPDLAQYVDPSLPITIHRES
jgi:hypothetical protein